MLSRACPAPGAHVLTPKSWMVCSTALRISSGLWSTKKAGVTRISLRSVGEDHTGVKTRFLRWLTPGVQQHGSTSCSFSPPREPRMLEQLLHTQDRQPSSHAAVSTLFVISLSHIYINQQIVNTFLSFVVLLYISFKFMLGLHIDRSRKVPNIF